jgi:RHS repeat-associated protein
MNRLLSKSPDPSLGEPAVQFTYTLTGRRASMADAVGTTQYTYDLRDRILTKVAPQGTLTYTWDHAGNLLSVRSSNTNGTGVNYAYDNLNRVATVTDNRPGMGNTTYTYDAVGNLAGVLYPNGVQSSYTYDSLNRLTNLTAAKGSTLASYAYSLGAAGNRLSVTEASGRKAAYGYDALYRLTGETITGDPDSANGAVGYTYDPVGNRLTRISTLTAVPAATSAFDANDRLNSDGYDLNGATTSSGGNAYTYDFEGRLKQMNSGAVSIQYDGDGNRVGLSAAGVNTAYLVDTANPTGYPQVIEELVNGVVQRVYTYGITRISQSQVISGTWVTSFYGYDGQGSVRFLSGSTGAVTDHYTYDAFGNQLVAVGATPNVNRYVGEAFDAALQMMYLRARYMNPGSGRFWTADPAQANRFDPSSLHRYLYAAADPVNMSDPTGLMVSDNTLVGNQVHLALGTDFVMRHCRALGDECYANYFSVNRILGRKSVANGELEPDLTDVTLKEVYEIKPDYSEGLADLWLYLSTLRGGHPDRQDWHPGTEYQPLRFIPVIGPGWSFALIRGPENGVITYIVMDLKPNIEVVALAGVGMVGFALLAPLMLDVTIMSLGIAEFLASEAAAAAAASAAAEAAEAALLAAA